MDNWINTAVFKLFELDRNTWQIDVKQQYSNTFNCVQTNELQLVLK